MSYWIVIFFWKIFLLLNYIKNWIFCKKKIVFVNNDNYVEEEKATVEEKISHIANKNYSKVFDLYLNFNNVKIFNQHQWYKLWLTELSHVQTFMLNNTRNLILENAIITNNECKLQHLAELNMKRLKNVCKITIKYPNLKIFELYDYFPYKNYNNLDTLNIYIDRLFFNFDELPVNLKSFTLYCIFNIDIVLINNKYCILNTLPQNLKKFVLKSDDPCWSFTNHYSHYDKNNIIKTHVYSKLLSLLPKTLKYFRLDTSIDMPQILLDTLLPKNLKFLFQNNNKNYF